MGDNAWDLIQTTCTFNQWEFRLDQKRDIIGKAAWGWPTNTGLGFSSAKDGDTTRTTVAEVRWLAMMGLVEENGGISPSLGYQTSRRLNIMCSYWELKFPRSRSSSLLVKTKGDAAQPSSHGHLWRRAIRPHQLVHRLPFYFSIPCPFFSMSFHSQLLRGHFY